MQTLNNFEKCSGLKGYVDWKEYKFFRDTWTSNGVLTLRL